MSESKTKFPFKLEGQTFELFEEKVTVKKIIELAKEKGLPATKHSVSALISKSKDCVYSESDSVNLSEENDFRLKIKTYNIKINGHDLESSSNKLEAQAIIKMAKEKGVILPGGEINLLLESVGGEPSCQFKLADKVDFNQFYEFLLILNEPTPVA